MDSREDLNNPFNAPLIYNECCGSTMTEAASLDELQHGTVVYTSYQTEGRGRGKNRSWMSARGDSLLFTVIIDPGKTVHPPVRIPLVCALALENMLRTEYDINSHLKWPNDILIKGKKISGILCEFRRGRILAGIGINIKQDGFPEEIRSKATSLLLEGAQEAEAESVLESFLSAFYSKLNFPGWKAEAENLLYGKGQILDVLEGGTENPKLCRIRIRGLSDEGFLIVEDVNTGRIKELKAGEISFRGFGNFS